MRTRPSEIIEKVQDAILDGLFDFKDKFTCNTAGERAAAARAYFDLLGRAFEENNPDLYIDGGGGCKLSHSSATGLDLMLKRIVDSTSFEMAYSYELYYADEGCPVFELPRLRAYPNRVEHLNRDHAELSANGIRDLIDVAASYIVGDMVAR